MASRLRQRAESNDIAELRLRPLTPAARRLYFMSDVEQALLAAIVAAPADDGPRLVYADWLEENGQPIRAEFIRLQCDIALKADLPQVVRNTYVDLWRRQQELFDHHMPQLLGPGRERLEAFAPRFERGFLDDLTLFIGDYRPTAKLIAELQPLPARVRVTGLAGHIPAILKNGPTILDPVTDLQMGEALYPEGVITDYRALFSRPRLINLGAFQCLLSDEDLRTIAVIDAPRLTELDISNNNITDIGLNDLLDGPLPKQLVNLVLGGNPITDAGAVELAERWPLDGPLKHLNMRFTDIGRAGHQALTRRFGGVVDLF